MLSRENKSYDCRYVTKDNKPFEFECGHIITTSITTIVDFNSSDELNKWNDNKVKWNCPECEKKEELRLQQEQEKEKKELFYSDLQGDYSLTVNSFAFSEIYYLTIDLMKLIDNNKFPNIYKAANTIVEQFVKYNKEIDDMTTAFDSELKKSDLKTCLDILNDHIARTESMLNNIHYWFIKLIEAIYTKPSDLDDTERKFLYIKVNGILEIVKHTYKQREVREASGKLVRQELLDYIQNNADKPQ